MDVDNEELLVNQELPKKIKEVQNFVCTIINLKNSIKQNGHLQFDLIRERLSEEYEKSEDSGKYDSGFESDTSKKAKNQKILFTTAKYLFESRGESAVLRKCLEHLLNFIESLQVDKYKKDDLESCLNKILILVKFLAENGEITKVKGICKLHIEALLNIAVMSQDDIQKQFTLLLCEKYSELPWLFEVVFDLILQKILIFSHNSKKKNFNITLAFVHDTDFNNILLSLLIKMKKRKIVPLSGHIEEKLLDVLENYKDADNFFSTAILLYRLLDT